MLLFAGEHLKAHIGQELDKALRVIATSAMSGTLSREDLVRRCHIRTPRLFDEAETCKVSPVEGGRRFRVTFTVPYDGAPDCLYLSQGDAFDDDAVEVEGRNIVITMNVAAMGQGAELVGAARAVIARHDRMLSNIDARMEAQAREVVLANAEIDRAIAANLAVAARVEAFKSGLLVALDEARNAPAETAAAPRAQPRLAPPVDRLADEGMHEEEEDQAVPRYA